MFPVVEVFAASTLLIAFTQLDMKLKVLFHPYCHESFPLFFSWHQVLYLYTFLNML